MLACWHKVEAQGLWAENSNVLEARSLHMSLFYLRSMLILQCPCSNNLIKMKMCKQQIAGLIHYVCLS